MDEELVLKTSGCNSFGGSIPFSSAKNKIMKTKEEAKLDFEMTVKRLREEREIKRKEYWNDLKPFNEPNDIPEIPRVDEKEYKEFYIPRLIKAGAIPKKDLIHGQVYIGDHRNTDVARWNQETNKFDHMRYKFGWMEDDCNHFEDDDGFALFVPIKLGTEEDWTNRLTK